MHDKLHKLLKETIQFSHTNGDNIEINPDVATEAVLNLFADEGYLQSLKHNGKTLVVNGKDPLGYVVYYPDEIMTGQEWANELNKLDPPVYVHNDGKTYYMFEQEKLDNFLAAKRASGIKDD